MAKKATKQTGESPPSPAPLTTETDLRGGSSHKMKLRSKPAERRRIGEKENQLKLSKASKKKGQTKKKKVGGGKLLESKNKPKKPPTAFFYFLEDFRKGYQEQNPDVKSMRDVGKACGEKWKTMSYEEKVKYYDIATEKRAEFDKAMVEYNKKMVTSQVFFSKPLK
uniref:HMG box domain-containing protein n=1 Tax=Kalanchoe fedtschenkoi TaxID=63787 RepID=A0A7N0RDT8_KALFE